VTADGTPLAFGAPIEADGLDVVLAGVSIAPDGGLVVAVELEDGTQATVRLPAHAVNWPAVVEAGRAA
jgi:hypothetical protein